MAQTSHIVSSKPRDKKDKNVALNATNAAVKNILTRNPRLPKELVQQHAYAELTQAQKNGRLFTAKELAEVEDKVYAQINVKLTYGSQAQHVHANKRINTAGIFGGGTTLNDYQAIMNRDRDRGSNSLETTSTTDRRHYNNKSTLFKDNQNLELKNYLEGKLTQQPTQRKRERFSISQNNDYDNHYKKNVTPVHRNDDKMASNYQATISKA